jgi:large subunit ribosomal protein L18
MNREKRKQAQRRKRHYRVRNRVRGTAERPRLSVFRSLKNIYAQIVNDDDGRTLVATSTMAKDVRDSVKKGGDIKAAAAVGAKLAQLALAAGVKKVAFDRGYRRFHGRIKALSEAARKGGLQF